MADLTNRELQVLRLIAEGDSNPEIGRKLFLAETTIKTHVQRLTEKLEARNRVHAVTVAHHRGLLADTNRDNAVWVSPQRLGGKPCIGGHRLSVDQITRLALDGVDAVLAGWPYLTRPQVLVACWYQAVHGPRVWRRRWGVWATGHGDAMWSGRWNDVPDPTSSQGSTA